MQSWGVVALADEPGALIAAFAGWHLAQGAAEVHICLDRPNPEARDLLTGVPGVFLCEAGEDGWAFNGVGHRPARHLGRQKYHASRVLAQTRLDWLVHCDADEFVRPLKGSVAGVLSAVRPGASYVRIPVAERVFVGDPGPDIFGGQFRAPWDGQGVYDEAQRLLLNRGVAGHQIGKSATRAGRGLFLGIHQPMRDYGGGGRDVPFDRSPELRLLHFDGLTELHYALKMMRRALALRVKAPPPHGPHRLLQIETLAAVASDPAAIHEQWRAAKTITPAQAEALRAEGVLSDDEVAMDLSAAAFDRALIAREGALIEAAHRAFGFDPAPFMA
ncbi:glycosyltransferase family 2 protein [Paenirhodobacter sp.]|uniref:glycosyltransferase family 2 protein n=1 Tax=Paenirhodobacter sp. TaxID=1965326 RepID=UPI003B3E8346